MILTLALLAVSYTGIGLLIYSAAKNTDMPKREQLKYSIVWPWLFIATLACFAWDTLFPSED